ncbi:MAG TPA: ABC transporter ATP-binding protein [Kiloniellales bacterium]|nr:ABC transporter ATP-binding protein [Kiloniellales bacterium]
MSALQLRGVTKRFGDFLAVDGASLEVPNGTFVCMLGPSGCGKTTLLRMIAGLEAPSEGTILIGDEDITPIPTHKRDFGMVFQSLALFPHLNVGDNIAYPLRIRGVDKTARHQRVEELLALIDLPGYAGRAISQLSGGQRQRVAIARALALSPRLFLLDEPLSALDAKLREVMQVELRQLQQQLGITTIVVTHDQREAMTMADLVVVMADGRIRQAAPPVEIYRRPADSFVAGFIGSTNLLPLDSDSRVLGRRIPGIAPPSASTGAQLSIRPEDVRLVPPEEGILAGTVTFVRDLGSTIETFVEAGGHTLIAVTAPHRGAAFAVGDAVGIDLSPESCVVLKS